MVQETLNQLFGENPVAPEEVYMIGDRKFDVEGAKALGVESVGVTYGYGSKGRVKGSKSGLHRTIRGRTGKISASRQRGTGEQQSRQ